jgi:chromosome segregation ATPase
VGEADVRHPGARPSEIEFPFAEAQRVLAAIDAELDDLQGCAAEHEQCAESALADARGLSTRAFWSRLGSRISDLARRRQELAEQRAQLEAAVARARSAQEVRDRQIATWQRQMDEYQRARAEAS